MEISLKDFNKCCRCCLLTGEALQPLFGGALDEMLMTLMHLQVAQNDGYPQQICQRCVLKLSSAHTFYVTVTESHTILEQILKGADANGEQSTLEDSGGQKRESMIESNKWDEEVNTVEKVHYIQPGNHRQESPGIESGSDNSSDSEEGYQCLQCGHTSTDQGQLKAHLCTHVVSEPHKKEGDSAMHLCYYCGARFRLRTSLFKHVRCHRGLTHQCPHCPKKFAEASCLNVHLITHSVDNPRPFHCTKCDRSFTQKSSLNKHEKLHSTRQKLQCQLCEKSFLYKSSLQRHRESAHVPDECPLCNKLFSSKKLLDAHIRSHKKDESSKLQAEKPPDSIMTESINIQAVTVEFQCLICSNQFKSRKSLEGVEVFKLKEEWNRHMTRTKKIRLVQTLIFPFFYTLQRRTLRGIEKKKMLRKYGVPPVRV